MGGSPVGLAIERPYPLSGLNNEFSGGVGWCEGEVHTVAGMMGWLRAVTNQRAFFASAIRFLNRNTVSGSKPGSGSKPNTRE